MFNKSINYMKRKSFLAKASMMLLAVLFSLTGARAQQTLPYSYGFEDQDLSTDGWVAQGATAESTAILDGGGCPKTGNYGFAITYSEENFYLISPLLVGGEDGVLMSFWYKEYSSEYGDEQFQVGYTTDEAVTDATEFTYGDVVTASTDWQEYSNSFPAGTKRIAIKYIYNDCYFLFLDDFSFEAVAEFMTPTNLVASEVGPYSAKLSWTERGEATSWVISVYDETEEDSFGEFTTSENPYTLTGLTPNHTYSVYVRPAGDNNQWSDAAFFKTFFPAPAEFAANKITANSAEISWTVDAAATGLELQYIELPTPTDVEELSYDDGIVATNLGGSSSSAWTWGTMYPVSMLNGKNFINKVSFYEVPAYHTNDFIVNIYSGGDNEPGTLVMTKTVSPTGNEGFLEVPVQIAIDPTKNLWITLTTIGTYVMAMCNSTESNNQWVMYGGDWYHVGDLGDFSSKGWLIRADIGNIDFSSLAWTTKADAISPVEVTELTEETTYIARIRAIYGEDGASEWTYTTFATLSANPVPFNIEADLAADGATLTWEGTGDSYNVQYRTPAADTPLFEADFSNGWTIYTEGDAAGAWTLNSGSMTAHSWTNSDGALNADNWLISPAVELNGTLKFTVGVEDAYADSYEVLLSTTGIDIADFTTELQTMAPGTNGQRVSIDLSAYAGETGYIAIHHVDNDNNYLSISNLGIYEAVPAGAWESMAVTGTTATISGLATNKLYEYQIQSVKDGNTSEWSEAGEFALLTLDSDADNTSLISTFDGKLAHVTLANRTLYKNGTWNTICLPFTLTDLTDTPLEGADVRTLSGVNVSDYTITLNFTNEGAIETAWGEYYGGVPYLLKWDDDTDIVNPEFANVIIESDLSNMTYGNAIGVTFKGTYAPLSFIGENKSILFVGAENKLYWPLAGAKIGAMRGYFEIDGTEAEIAEASAKQFILNFGDEDATSIETISTSVESESIYNLAGQKMSKMQKGINIVNGKKILK